MKRILKKLLVLVLIIPTMLIFVACGKNGLSAYEIAVNNGFVGTEAEWLESLKGEMGSTGASGADGEDGSNSITSYEMFLEAQKQGYSKTYVEWIKENFNIVIDADLYSTNKNLLSVVEINCYSAKNAITVASRGSGVVYKKSASGDIYIVTNYHVTYNANAVNKNYPIYSSFKLSFFGQEGFYSLPASYVGGSSTYDIAVLKVSKADLDEKTWFEDMNVSPISMVNAPAKAGSPVISIGNTEGNGINITSGLITKESESVTITIGENTCKHRVLVHDAYITNGNSGGGLFDLNGDFVGLTNAGKTNNDRINYAIPASLVKVVSDQIIKNTEADPTAMSVKIADLKITNFTFNTFSYNDEKTNLVEIYDEFRVRTIAGDSVFNGKLQVGDVYLSASVNNGTEFVFKRAYEFEEFLLSLEVGDVLKFKVQRTGETNPVEVSATISANELVEVE